MFEDKTLVCRECGAEFVFTASEQQFYADKGFQNEPGRCPACRAARRAARRAQNGGNRGGERQMYDVICDGCGQSHSGSLPAPRRSPGVLPRVLRGPEAEPLLINSNQRHSPEKSGYAFFVQRRFVA